MALDMMVHQTDNVTWQGLTAFRKLPSLAFWACLIRCLFDRPFPMLLLIYKYVLTIYEILFGAAYYQSLTDSLELRLSKKLGQMCGVR